MTSSQNEYIEARELHPDYVRYECKHCGHGWILDTQDQPNYGSCAECRTSQDNDYMAQEYGVRKVLDGINVKYEEAL